MNASLFDLYDDILHARVSGAAVPEKKGFFGLFQKNQTVDLSAYHNELYQTLDVVTTYNGINDNARQVMIFLKPAFKQPAEMFSQSPVVFQQSINVKALDGCGHQQFCNWIPLLVDRGWIEGERRLLFRNLLLGLSYRLGEVINYRLLDSQHGLLVFDVLPETYRKEAFLIAVISMTKRDSISETLAFVTPAIELFQLTNAEEEWLFQFIEQASSVQFKGHLPLVLRVLRAFSVEICMVRDTQGWQAVSALKLESLQTFPQLSALSVEQLSEVMKVATMFKSGDYAHYGIVYEMLKGYFFAKMEEGFVAKTGRTEDTEAALVGQLHIVMASWNKVSLPDEFLKFLLKAGSELRLTEELYEAVWDYYFGFTFAWGNKSFDKIIRHQTTLRLLDSGKEATWEALLLSGFYQVRIPSNHSPYHGLHPDQVRPYFQLLRSVADIDIVKIYKVEKQYRVRFVFQGEMFDIPTGDGFGVGCLNDLNTLLFEKGVPYQLAVLKVKLFSQYPNTQYTPSVVTLLSEATYHQFLMKVPPQNFAGFASCTPPPPVFLKNIEDLPALRAKPEMDVIQLEDDPKFNAIREVMDKLQPMDAWSNLLHHCLKYPLDAKPGAGWQKDAKGIVEGMGVEHFRSGMLLVTESIIKSDEWFSDDEKTCGLRGLTWLCRLHHHAGLLFLLQKIANKAYKKVPGGPLNAKLGNLALDSLVAVGSVQAFGALGNLKAKAKYSVYERAIASAMKKFADLLQQFPASELQDRVVPDHEMQGGQKIIPIGTYEAVLQLQGLKVNLSWRSDKGKTITSVPVELKRDAAAGLQEVKSAAKSIEETLQAQAARLENSWLEERSWTLPFWQEFLQRHALMGVLTERLIWQASANGQVRSFMPGKEGFADSRGNAIEIPAEANIQLWHPALAASAEEVMEWRNLLFQRQVVQPFKQAFREVYLLTPAEETTFDHSLRFAGHILKGNTLYSLGKNRAWTMTYDQAPIRKLPGANLVAILEINGGVLYTECTTEGLHFRNLEGHNTYDWHRKPKLPLREVPPVILSEVMRDVDLFVAVSNVGIDPYFDQKNTGNLLNYWRDVSFGPKSRTSIADIRKDLLERLLPMTKIAKLCKVEGNNLHVAGKLRSYKINLSSGNILMSPNDQYLCIVKSHDPKVEKQFWLPFEGGDQMLTLILSKAFLLADDDKITDNTILRQLGR